MNTLEENIKEIAAEIIEHSNFFIVDLVVHGKSGSRSIEIYIDGEQNVSADDCAKLSLEINPKLESLPDIGTNYYLEVSSPGVDRPLKFLKQYPKHINRKFEISFNSGDETKKITGKLTGIEGENLIFYSSGRDTIINFNNIIKAKVLVSFS